MAQDHTENIAKKSYLLDNKPNQLVGSFLQRERLKKQFTLEEVATETCIHIGTIRAIENNNRSKMPAPVFARGFIKLYAEFLGLDSQEIVEKYNREADPVEDNINDNPDALYNEKLAKSSPFVSLRTCVIFLFFAVLFTLGYYFFLYSSPTPTLQDYLTSFPIEQDQPAAVHEPEAHSKKNTKATEYNDTVTDEKESILPHEVTEQKEKAARPEKTSRFKETTDPATEIKLTESIPKMSPAAKFPLKPEVKEEPVEAIGEDISNTLNAVAVKETAEIIPLEDQTKKLHLRIEFTERTWMQVSLDNKAPEQYLFDPAEESSWVADEKIKLHIGNAGGVHLFLDGKKLPVGGMSGSPLLLTIPDDFVSNN